MIGLALALVLVWDQPYPDPAKGEAPADGVRCYFRRTLGWLPFEAVPNAGPCHPDAVINAAPSGMTRFMVRGYRGDLESGDSNEWRLCACDVAPSPPPPNAATDGLCRIYHWVCGDIECLDRSEFVACAVAP